MGSLMDDALNAHKIAEDIRLAEKAKEQADASKRAAKTWEILIKKAKIWAIPILNKTLGQRDDWVFTNPAAKGPLDPEEPVSVDVRINEYKSLTVYPDGRIYGFFDKKGDWSNETRYAKTQITSLEQLGRELKTEKDVHDWEMRNAL